ncbi:MAG: hypothetical protein IJ829_03740 [Kiritimatiellae bacterium]|nr:hypothetical protein [Kiritimatiellia bacterium]
MSENTTPNGALSVYGQDGLEDFPVLKAFQQYIDAEQIKSRKRMVMLSVFFAALMTIMVAAFLMVLKDANAKNQSLNDRLIEYVMKERERQSVVVQPPPVVAPQPSGSESALKAMTETLVALQKQISDQQALLAKAQAPAPAAPVAAQPVAPVAAPPVVQPTPEQNAVQKKIDSDTEKLKRAHAALKAEKEKLAAEKERLRKQEIELHRRRLYPEYYEKIDREAEESAASVPAKKPPAARTSASKPTPKPAAASDAVSYFDDFADDEPTGAKPLDDDELDDLDVPPPARPVKKPFIVPQASTAPAPKSTTPAPKSTAPAAKPAAVKKPAERQVVAAKPSAEKPVAERQAAEKPTAERQAAAPVKHVAKTAEEALKPPAKAPDKAAVSSIPVEINGEASDWLVPGA